MHNNVQTAAHGAVRPPTWMHLLYLVSAHQAPCDSPMSWCPAWRASQALAPEDCRPACGNLRHGCVEARPGTNYQAFAAAGAARARRRAGRRLAGAPLRRRRARRPWLAPLACQLTVSSLTVGGPRLAAQSQAAQVSSIPRSPVQFLMASTYTYSRWSCAERGGGQMGDRWSGAAASLLGHGGGNRGWSKKGCQGGLAAPLMGGLAAPLMWVNPVWSKTLSLDVYILQAVVC